MKIQATKPVMLEMNILSKGIEKPITAEMILAVLKKLAQAR